MGLPAGPPLLVPLLLLLLLPLLEALELGGTVASALGLPLGRADCVAAAVAQGAKERLAGVHVVQAVAPCSLQVSCGQGRHAAALLAPSAAE